MWDKRIPDSNTKFLRRRNNDNPEILNPTPLGCSEKSRVIELYKFVDQHLIVFGCLLQKATQRWCVHEYHGRPDVKNLEPSYFRPHYPEMATPHRHNIDALGFIV